LDGRALIAVRHRDVAVARLRRAGGAVFL